MRKLIVFIFLTFISFTEGLLATEKNDLQAQNKHISFTENKGQFADQNYDPRPDVLFGGTDGQITFFITNKGISYQLYRADSYKEVEDPRTREKRNVADQQTIYRTDIEWLNTNLKPLVKTDEELPGYNNYYLEQCPNGALNVKSYKGITLQNIYNNIDLHYYEKEGQLKYDYIVAPNTDYKQIQFIVKGAGLKLQEDGSLLIETPLGTIQEEAPIVYQNGRRLKANYKINNNHISFEVKNYNSNYQLIIDPVTRLWGTYYGGSGNDYGYSCAADANGNAYMTGYTNCTTNNVIATSGSHQITNGGNMDAFLVKFNSAGVRQFGTYYGGAGGDLGYSCTVDAAGNSYMVGNTGSSGGGVIATVGSHQTTYGGGTYDAFLVKFNNFGFRQFGTYYGGAAEDCGASCSIDQNGNIFMAGYTAGSANGSIATAASHQSVYGGGNYDAFVVKFSISGIRSWGTYYGGYERDWGTSCSADASGNVYLCGYTKSFSGTVIATPGSHQSVSGSGNVDAYLVKFNSSGTRIWGTYYAGSDISYALSCANDVFGNIIFCGWTAPNSGTAIATVGSHQSTYGGAGADAYLAKFDSNGTRLWGTFYGGTGSEYGYSCATDITGNIYMSGITSINPGTTIATPGSHQTTFGGAGYDAYLVKFSSNGARYWGTYYGGTGDENGFSCAVDNFSNQFLAGWVSTSTTGIATTGAHQSTHAGGDESFLVKFSDCSTISPPSAISGPVSVCFGSVNSYSVTKDSTASSYNWTLPGGWTGASLSSTILTTAGAVGILTITANNLCSTSSQATLQVNVIPLPLVVVNSGSICSGNSFTITPSGANSYTITGGNFTVNPLVNTSYSIIGIGNSGCVSTIAVSNVTVDAMPTVVANSGSICSGNSFTLSPSGANTYTVTGGSFVVSPAATTSYSVTGTSTAGCVSAQAAVANITVHALPVVSVNNGTICEGESFTISPTGANTHTITGGNFLVSPTVTSSYSVVGTNTFGCVSAETVCTVAVDICAGIRKTSGDESITIYPNPSSGILNIELREDVTVSVIDQLGRIIAHQNISKGSSQMSIAHVQNGVYSIEIIHLQRKYVFKIIKQ